MSGQPNFGILLERYFTQRLMQQRRASAHTIASYRDTFKMLLQFVHKRLRKAPSALALNDIDAPLVMAFLDEMERARGITARTRNLRLCSRGGEARLAGGDSMGPPGGVPWPCGAATAMGQDSAAAMPFRTACRS